MRAFARSSSIACAIAASRLYFKNASGKKNKPRRDDDILPLPAAILLKFKYIVVMHFELFILK